MKHFTKILIAVLAITAFGLLLGNRFGFIWAGGDGYEEHQRAILPTFDEPYATFERGEVISTIDPAYDAEGNYQSTPLYVEFGSTQIWMDENTEVKLIDGREGKEIINVLQGRVVVKGSVTIEVREVDVLVNGTASYVHYSWLDKVELAVIEGEATIARAGETETFVGHAVRTNTLPPYENEYIDFDPATSSAATFYKKTGL